MTGTPSAPLRMREMLYGALLSRALCTAAVMGVPDALAEGPRSVAAPGAEIVSVPAALGLLLG
ncbi:methyltransferase, partial [Streptomyces rubiginosohelvolus]